MAQSTRKPKKLTPAESQQFWLTKWNKVSKFLQLLTARNPLFNALTHLIDNSIEQKYGSKQQPSVTAEEKTRAAINGLLNTVGLASPEKHRQGRQAIQAITKELQSGIELKNMATINQPTASSLIQRAQAIRRAMDDSGLGLSTKPASNILAGFSAHRAEADFTAMVEDAPAAGNDDVAVTATSAARRALAPC